MAVQTWKSLNTPVKMEGKGFWEADHIELNQLSAHSKEVKMKEVKNGTAFVGT